MKKLTKILLTAALLAGVGLVGIGLHKDNKAFIYTGLAIGTSSAGIALRPLTKHIDYNPKKKSKNYTEKI